MEIKGSQGSVPGDFSTHKVLGHIEQSDSFKILIIFIFLTFTYIFKSLLTLP